MRIDLQPGPQAASGAAQSGAQNSSAANRSDSPLELGQDQAQLSGAHIQAQALAAQALQLPDVRAGKIQALREAVHRGSYRTDPEQTAGALVDEMILRPSA
jgi:flagellar biosynthesis anti-sigma factor FlgM